MFTPSGCTDIQGKNAKMQIISSVKPPRNSMKKPLTLG